MDINLLTASLGDLFSLPALDHVEVSVYEDNLFAPKTSEHYKFRPDHLKVVIAFLFNAKRGDGFPTRHAVFSEAAQRIRATFYGCALGLAILGLFTLSQHLPVLLALIFLGCLWLASKMLRGPHPSAVYQYAISVAMSLIAGALSTQDAGYAAFTRIMLTLAGAFAAAGAVALLDALTGWRDRPVAPARQVAG